MDEMHGMMCRGLVWGGRVGRTAAFEQSHSSSRWQRTFTSSRTPGRSRKGRERSRKGSQRSKKG